MKYIFFYCLHFVVNLSVLGNVQSNFVPRSGNQAAYNLARVGLHSVSHSIWVEAIPLCVAHYVLNNLVSNKVHISPKKNILKLSTPKGMKEFNLSKHHNHTKN